MKHRHAIAAERKEGSPRHAARRIAISVAAIAALVLTAYGYLSLEERPDHEAPAASCPGCAGVANAPADADARQGVSRELGGPAALAGRIVSAVRTVFAALETAWQYAGFGDSATTLDADGQCGQGVPDFSGRCGRSDSGSYPRSLSGLSARAPSGQLSSIGGRVMDANGFGIQGIPVTIVSIRTYEQSQSKGHETGRPATTTDASGYYEFTGLLAGDYEVRTAASDAYGPGRLAARSGVQNADIVLVTDDTLVIEGEVVGVVGERLEAVTVLPVLVGVASARTDALGSYRLEVPVKPGTRSLTVRFQMPGFLDHVVAVDLTGRPGTGSIALNARMQPIQAWTSVSGVVRSATGSPLAGRSVSLRRVGGQTAYRTTTDRGGRYSFDAVEAPLPYYLSVSGAPDHEDHRRKIDVAKNAARFNVVVDPFEYGTVSGRLVNADGAPVSNFDLVLRNKASQSPSAVVSSDVSGNFRVTRAPAGELTIASQSSPSILVRGLRLAPGVDLDVALVLDWGDHELRGVVVDHNNNPVPATKVLLTWSHVEGGVTTTTTRRTRSDAQGVFNFSNLGPGPHLLQIDSLGRRPVKMTHDVSREGYFVQVGV